MIRLGISQALGLGKVGGMDRRRGAIWTLSAICAVVAGMAQVPRDTAMHNIGTYLGPLPKWLSENFTDTSVTVIFGLLAVTFFAAALLILPKDRKKLLAKMEAYAWHLQGRLHYVSRVIDKQQGLDAWYSKIDIQRADMGAFLDGAEYNLHAKAVNALESVRISSRELERFVDSATSNPGQYAPMTAARMYKGRAERLARSVNELIGMLSGPLRKARLIRGVPPSPLERELRS